MVLDVKNARQFPVKVMFDLNVQNIRRSSVKFMSRLSLFTLDDENITRLRC